MCVDGFVFLEVFGGIELDIVVVVVEVGVDLILFGWIMYFVVIFDFGFDIEID